MYSESPSCMVTKLRQARCSRSSSHRGSPMHAMLPLWLTCEPVRAYSLVNISTKCSDRGSPAAAAASPDQAQAAAADADTSHREYACLQKRLTPSSARATSVRRLPVSSAGPGSRYGSSTRGDLAQLGR